MARRVIPNDMSEAECWRRRGWRGLPLRERILARTVRDGTTGCWIAQGCPVKFGYFQMKIGRKSYQMHRVAYEVFTGNEIPDGMYALHRCDNPACCNPQHIFPGTHDDNMRDMEEKGRSTKGMKNPRAKLTDADVIAIRRARAAENVSGRELARRLGLSAATVHKILNGSTWSHVPWPAE